MQRPPAASHPDWQMPTTRGRMVGSWPLDDYLDDYLTDADPHSSRVEAFSLNDYSQVARHRVGLAGSTCGSYSGSSAAGPYDGSYDSRTYARASGARSVTFNDRIVQRGREVVQASLEEETQLKRLLRGLRSGKVTVIVSWGHVSSRQ